MNKLAAQFGAHWAAASAQLQKTGKVNSDSMTSMVTQSESGKQRSAMLATIDMEVIKKNGLAVSGESIKDVQDGINTAMNKFNRSLPLNSVGSPVVNGLRDTINKSVYHYLSTGKTLKDATKLSVDAFINDRYSYLDNRGDKSTIRVPKTFNPDYVDNGIKQFQYNLNADKLDVSDNKLVNPFTGEPDPNGFINKIRSSAVWETNQFESGVSMFYIGKDNQKHQVLDKNKNPIELSFKELSNSGMASFNSESTHKGYVHGTKNVAPDTYTSPYPILKQGN